MRNLLGLLTLSAALLSCSETQTFDAKNTKVGSSYFSENETEMKDSAETVTPEGKVLGNSLQDESADPPEIIIGSYLSCTLLSKQTVEEYEATVGCSIMQDNQKMNMDAIAAVNWNFVGDPSLAYITTPLLTDAAYHVKIQIKAPNEATLDEQLPVIRIIAAFEQKRLEAKIVFPLSVNVGVNPAAIPNLDLVEGPVPAKFTLRPAGDSSSCLLATTTNLLNVTAYALMPCGSSDTAAGGVASIATLAEVYSLNQKQQLTSSSGVCMNFTAGSTIATGVSCNDVNVSSFEVIGKQIREKEKSLCLASSGEAELLPCSVGAADQEWALTPAL